MICTATLFDMISQKYLINFDCIILKCVFCIKVTAKEQTFIQVQI